MDEESVVKVTRLRRRLSVEAEGAQSPATPSTPTKKRGARLAKPALELIDENVTENVPKRATRKSVARDAVEPEEERVLTPARRSARIRSNTSLVVEAALTVVDSPRARRASRRNSQIGSDTETTTTTPARQNRRTRKDSSSSVEKLAIPITNEKVTAQVAEAITEEPETEIINPKDQNGNNQSPSLRKSPRLNKKGIKSIEEAVKDISESIEHKDKTLSNDSKLADKTLPSLNGPTITANFNSNDKSSSKSHSKDSEKENLSLISANLIDDIDSKPKRSSILSKTTSVIEDLGSEKPNRKRTKSWTTITSHLPTEDGNQNQSGSGDNVSKNEKLAVKSPNKSINTTAFIVNSPRENKENLFLKSVDILDVSETLKILEKPPSKDIQPVVFMEDTDSNSGSIGKLTIDLQNDGNDQHDGGDQCVPIAKQLTSKRSISENFTVEPMDIDETIPQNVTINDCSDKSNSSREEEKTSNSKRKSSISHDKSIDVRESFSKSKTTLPQESHNSKRKSSISNSKENSNDSKEALNTFNKSSLQDKKTIHNENGEIIHENVNISKQNSPLLKVRTENDKRKSSVSSQVEGNETGIISEKKSESEIISLEKSLNENKSTLVLSQLKDLSANEISNTSKSSNNANNEHSKSINIPVTEAEKKNLSLNYSTSTPLQQKPLQKNAMQINTSVISPNAEIKNTSKVSKIKSPIKKIIDTKHDSDTSSDESSMEKSKMVDDEAEEVSENYESGDSRDNEEKEYEREHEILEKGETLESEQEISNDSEYEKDSFIVSSDEEDDELLSGSGDDLSFSDNELKMTAKSKKKFDERKRKEQKNASKEMYQARHNLNKSDKNSKLKNKKSKRQRLDSSVLGSEEEDEAEPKEKNRLRIDSSEDVSLNNSDADESIRVMKKKVKRLSESVCEGNADVNEKEITVCNHSVNEENDPLSVAIKLELKTPQKDFNMSTILINNNIEEVQLDANATTLKSNETSDPLQVSLVCEDDESDSDISENMEIKENYDSVLEILNQNNNNSKKVKTMDTSLNLNKKIQDRSKVPSIVDQLNLTQTKKSKKNKTQIGRKNEINEEQSSNKREVLVSARNDEGDVSDSIDMRLLFPEDSNDSETNANKFEYDEKQDVEPVDQFIRLKRTEAKTNIRDSLDVTISKDESELNLSLKKSKNRKSSQTIPEATTNADEPEETNVSFFIDTVGTYEDMDVLTENKSKKNKHKQNMSEDNAQNDVNDEVSESEKAQANVSQEIDKKKKKKSKLFKVSVTGENPLEPLESSLSDKNNKSKITVSEDTSVNVSLKSNKKKKKNKSFNVSETGEETVTPSSEIFVEASEQPPVDVSLKRDKKKEKKNNSFDVSQIVDNRVFEDIPANVSLNSHKKKKDKNVLLDASQIINSTAFEETTVNLSLDSDKKKKKKIKLHDVPPIIQAKEPEDIPFEVSKSKKHNKSDIDASEETTADVSTNSDNKKKKKHKSLEVPQMIENIEELAENGSQKKDKKKKKKDKSHEVSQAVHNTGVDSDEAPLEVSFKREKYNTDNADLEADDTVLPSSKNKFKKKKKNKSASQSQTDMTTVNTHEGDVNLKKRKRNKNSAFNDDADDEVKMSKSQKKRKISENEGDNYPSLEGIGKKSKKRKATEDNDSQKKTKVLKENSFDKIHVPRLPDSLVEQLDDQPPKELKKQKKIKAISTVPFEVEETKKRKNKPSNYLEQSIYLNDSPVKQKQKLSIKTPKVLPFTPTAITSGKGYTSQFRINVLPEETQFTAQASEVGNFKNEYLSNRRIKKMGTFERFKRQRNQKLSKF